MLNFRIESLVSESFELVSANFGKDLFVALAPAFPPSELLAFDGDRVGGLVKIRVGKGPLSKVWVSEIISRSKDNDKLVFVDVGIALPPPLKEWRHTHSVLRHSEGGTMIIDDISFSSGLRLVDYAMYPVMKKMFAMRTPAYRKYYKELADR